MGARASWKHYLPCPGRSLTHCASCHGLFSSVATLTRRQLSASPQHVCLLCRAAAPAPVAAAPFEVLDIASHHPFYAPDPRIELTLPSYLSRNSYGLCLRASRSLPAGTLIALASFAPASGGEAYTAGAGQEKEYLAVTSVSAEMEFPLTGVRGTDGAFCNHSWQSELLSPQSG